MVRRLESAGLGYHVGAKQTYEKIGKEWKIKIMKVQDTEVTFFEH